MVMSRPTMSIKQLYDSAYIKPLDNPRVIQDDNPKRQAAIANALARYENTLK